MAFALTTEHMPAAALIRIGLLGDPAEFGADGVDRGVADGHSPRIARFCTRVQKREMVWAVSSTDYVSWYEGTRMSSQALPPDPDLILELNRVTEEVLATLRNTAVVDRVTVVRLIQQMMLLRPDDPTYLPRMWENVLSLADALESQGRADLAVRLRSIAARR